MFMQTVEIEIKRNFFEKNATTELRGTEQTWVLVVLIHVRLRVSVVSLTSEE